MAVAFVLNGAVATAQSNYYWSFADNGQSSPCPLYTPKWSTTDIGKAQLEHVLWYLRPTMPSSMGRPAARSPLGQAR